ESRRSRDHDQALHGDPQGRALRGSREEARPRRRGRERQSRYRSMNTIHLGYELGSGDPVAIPIKHMAITGQTQESGKTTTLEALVTRGNLRAVAFVTKRAEGAFHTGRRIRPYFRERADWQFVAAVLE